MPPDQSRSVAIAQLASLGLSAYAARTSVALVGLGEGTAQDGSDAIDAPRTRAYDAVEESPRAWTGRRPAIHTEATLGSFDGDHRAPIRDAVPEAALFEPLWDWSDTPAGRLLMVVREQTLVSVLVTDDGEHPPGQLDETAIRGTAIPTVWRC